MDMQAILERQKAAHLRDGEASAALRIERIDRCIRLLRENRQAIEETLNTDFGSRSREATAFTDIAGSIGPLQHARDNLAKWMRPEKRKPTPAILGLFGAKAEVRFTLRETTRGSGGKLYRYIGVKEKLAKPKVVSINGTDIVYTHKYHAKSCNIPAYN